MIDENPNDLSFKRNYLLLCLKNMSATARDILKLCDRFRAWFLVIWTGTVMLSVTGLVLKSMVIKLLVMIVVLFYILEVYYRRVYIEYIRRANFLENWMLAASRTQLETLNRSLSHIIPKTHLQLLVKQFLHSMFRASTFVFYLVFIILMLAYRFIF